MESIFNSGLQIIQWMQALGAWLTPIMKLFTFLGNAEFYLIVAPAILWCIDATLGLRVGLFLMVNGMVNSAFKVAFHGPRPYWYTSQVKVLGAVENSFGVPSGHAQNAVVVWGALADRIKTRAAWVIAVILMVMIGLSRIYLAVHFPHDVLLGWVFGVIILWTFLRLEKPILSWLVRRTVAVKLLVAFLFSLFLILIVLLAQLTVQGWTLPAGWVFNAHLAFPTDPEINPLSIHNILPSSGAFFGLSAGWMWISKLGGFTTRDRWYKLILRYIVGVIGMLILYVGLGEIFAETETFLSYAYVYVQYTLIGFWIAGFAPWVFIKLRLASSLKT